MVTWSKVEYYPPVTNMAIHLCRLGWSVRLHCLGSDSDAQPSWADGLDVSVVRHGDSTSPLAKGRTLHHMAKVLRTDMKDAALLVLHSFQAFGIFSIVKFSTVSCPILYAAHEFYPRDQVTLPHRLAKALEMKYARHCVVCVPDPFRGPLHHWELGLPEPPLVVRNCPLARNDGECSGENRRRRARSEGIVIGYCGRMSEPTGTEVLVSAFAQLGPDFRLRMIGPIWPAFAEKFSKLIEDAPANVSYEGCVDYSQVGQFLSQCDAGILYYAAKSLNTCYCAPAKLFEYVSQGLPVLASPLPGLEALIEQEKLGYLFTDNTAAGIGQAVLRFRDEDLASTMSKRCHEVHYDRYNYQTQFFRLAQRLGLVTGSQYANSRHLRESTDRRVPPLSNQCSSRH